MENYMRIDASTSLSINPEHSRRVEDKKGVTKEGVFLL